MVNYLLKLVQEGREENETQTSAGEGTVRTQGSGSFLMIQFKRQLSKMLRRQKHKFYF